MNKKTASIIWAAVLLIVLGTWLTSCSIVRKVTHHAKNKNERTVETKTDSTHVKKVDSSVTHKVDSSGVSKKDQSNESGVQIDFQDSSDSHIEISTDSTGHQVIKASGKIKSVKANNVQKVSSIDSAHKTVNDSTGLKSSDSTHLKADTKIKEKDKYSSDDKTKTRVRLPLWPFLLIATIAFYIRYRKTINQFLKI